MNNKKRNILLCLLVIILVVFVIYNLQNEKEVYQDNILSTKDIMIKTKLDEIETSSKSIKAEYPEFQNLEKRFQEKINKKIYNELNDEYVFKEITEGLNEDEIGIFTYEVTYEKYNCGQYISLVAEQYIHMEPGRPRIQKKCYVINLLQNKICMLEDVFYEDVQYEELILAEIEKQAKEMNLELIGGNGLEKLNNKQQFYIKDNKLIIYFEASEIAATAVGELEFEMPFEMNENKFVI